MAFTKVRWDLSLAEEIPLAKPVELPTWTENYCWTGYDYQQHIGYWLHLGRWIEDATIWREEVIIYLPDGTALIRRAFGKGDNSKGPVGALLQFECEEPGSSWQIRYSGPVQRVNLVEQMRAPLPQPKNIDYFKMELRFEATAPVWRFAEQENTTVGRWRYEQHGKVAGTFDYLAKHFDFRGHGNRDHTRGPRELSPVRAHCWVHGIFAGGDSFSVFHLWHSHDGPEKDCEFLATAQVIESGRTFDAKVLSSPRLHSHEQMLEVGELVLELPTGRRLILECIPLNTMVCALQYRNSHMMFGAMLGDPEWPITMVEQPGYFLCDGQRAEGWIERSYYRNDSCFDLSKVTEIYAARRARSSA